MRALLSVNMFIYIHSCHFILSSTYEFFLNPVHLEYHVLKKYKECVERGKEVLSEEKSYREKYDQKQQEVDECHIEQEP